MNSEQEQTLSYAAIAASWRAAYRQSIIDDKPISIPFSKPWCARPQVIQTDSAPSTGASTSAPPPEVPAPQTPPAKSGPSSSAPPADPPEESPSESAPLSIPDSSQPMCYSPISSVTIESFSSSKSEEDSKSCSSRCYSWGSSVSSAELDFGYASSSPKPFKQLTPEGIESDCFRIDRRKLEELIQCETDVESVNAASLFFIRVMKITNTSIQWPRNLKVGANTHKNPFVKIHGTPENREWAQTIVLSYLKPTTPMIKLKVTLLKSDLPFIINFDGSNVFRIMNETQTQIRFRYHQVAIYGNTDGLEHARSQLHCATPLDMYFHMQVTCSKANFYESPIVGSVEANLNVKVSFFASAVVDIVRVLIRGTEGEASRVIEAARILSNCSVGKILASTVHIDLEISDELREELTKDDCAILDSVMHNTLTKIALFQPPDLLNSWKVTISGSPDGIHYAKRELLSCQPIELAFEVNNSDYDTWDILDIAEKHDVTVTFKRQERLNILRITLKGTERYIQQVYEAYEEVLKMFCPKKQPVFPKAHQWSSTDFQERLNAEKSLFDGIDMKIWSPSDPIKPVID